jgi:argininosuccinate lyase
MQRFNASISFDKVRMRTYLDLCTPHGSNILAHLHQKLWAVDIMGSKAYTKALVETGLLTVEEASQIIEGLDCIKQEWVAGTFDLKSSDEDIHTANERRLLELIGPTGGKLHTGRSRNDQVTTDMRLWMREEVWTCQLELLDLIEVMCSCASEHVGLLMAGVTHMQPAQPIRYSHWLLSHAAPLQRDALRVRDLLPRLNVCPLGCGALAGHAFGMDREALAASMHFEGATLNSVDTVGDRDFIAEFLSVASLMLVHVSQLAEDVILLNWRKNLGLADAYATGSSLMPQKKNPDALELLRGKAGRVIGHATGFMCTLKGLPRSYNKDLQEDKEHLFDALETVHSCLKVRVVA